MDDYKSGQLFNIKINLSIWLNMNKNNEFLVSLGNTFGVLLFTNNVNCI